MNYDLRTPGKRRGADCSGRRRKGTEQLQGDGPPQTRYLLGDQGEQRTGEDRESWVW